MRFGPVFEANSVQDAEVKPPRASAIHAVAIFSSAKRFSICTGVKAERAELKMVFTLVKPRWWNLGRSAMRCIRQKGPATTIGARRWCHGCWGAGR